MIIKKGESSRPKCIHNGKNGQHLGILLLFRKKTFGDSSCISVKTFGDSSVLTEKIWGFRINIVNLHPINRIDYGKSF